MVKIQTVLGNNIRRLRRQREWSQVFLADKLDVSVSFISVVESGQRGISLALIEEIAKIFEVPVPYLFTDHEFSQEFDGVNPVQLAELENGLREGMNLFITEFFRQKGHPPVQSPAQDLPNNTSLI